MQANPSCLCVVESQQVCTASTDFQKSLEQSEFHDITFPASVNIWKFIDPLNLIWVYFKTWKNE